MTDEKSLHQSIPLPPPTKNRLELPTIPQENPTNKEPPRRPDWLVLLIIGLLLLTLLIVWLTDMPFVYFKAERAATARELVCLAEQVIQPRV
ncbi:hypothetical protein [Fibrisoma montanum]|uniref:hypothetical protein n=1 Tax=Fibrisoma montanum TaxID=2305895 RepID=UPI0011C216C1|nr:hypothetical protein [Fibrisoma montanum]